MVSKAASGVVVIVKVIGCAAFCLRGKGYGELVLVAGSRFESIW